jgi:exodeoxyribonuclease VII small subunit
MSQLLEGGVVANMGVTDRGRRVSKSSKSAGKEAGFEATLAQLEGLVSRMEAGDLPLDEALRNFEQGVKLARDCQQQLQQAQQRVQILQQEAGSARLVPFEPQSGDGDADDAEDGAL